MNHSRFGSSGSIIITRTRYPTLINGIIDRLIKINKDYGITLLVIEHNMKVIMSLAQKIFCLAHGKMLAEGSPDQIKNDKRVVDAYLGAQ